MERGRVPGLIVVADLQLAAQLQDLYTYLIGADADISELFGKQLHEDVSKASDVALAADPSLTFLLRAQRKYRISARLFFTGNVKFRHSGPAGVSLIRIARLLHDTAGGTFAFDQAYSAADVVLANPSMLKLEGVIHNGTTAGFLTMQWAQNASNVTPSTLYAGSWLQCSLLA